MEVGENAVRSTVTLIWMSIGLAAFSELLNIWTGSIDSSEFIGSILFLGIVCIFPYKILHGSNVTRYIYGVLVGISIIFILSGINEYQTEIDMIFAFITIPLDIYIVIRLFSDEANEWFMKKGKGE